MPEKLVFIFHHNFHPKTKVDLEDAEITPEIRPKLTDLQHKYDDIISKHGSDIGLTHLEEMKINTEPNLPQVESKLYPLPLKHHKFVKEEIENLLEVGLIETSMNPYATPIIVVPRKSKPGAPLAGTKSLVIYYRELTSKSPKFRLPRQNTKVA